MANISRVTVGSQTASATIPLSTLTNPFNVGLAVKLGGTPNLTYTVECTFDDVQSPTYNPSTATWYSVNNLTALSAGANSNFIVPVTAVRLSVTAWTSGTATLTVIQAGY